MVDTVEPVVGRTADASQHRQLVVDAMDELNWVPNGFVVSAGAGLTVDIAAGRAFLAGSLAERDVLTNVAVVASSTNHIFVFIDDILDDGVVYFHVDQDDTPPTQGPSTKLAEAVTDGVGVTGVTDKRQTNPLLTSEVSIRRSAAGSGILTGFVTGDAFLRVVIRASGQLEWGPGSAAVDLILSRGAAGRLDFAADDFYRLIGGVADPPSLADGAVWYRTDTDRFRLRAAAVTETLAFVRDIGDKVIPLNVRDNRSVTTDPPLYEEINTAFTSAGIIFIMPTFAASSGTVRVWALTNVSDFTADIQLRDVTAGVVRGSITLPAATDSTLNKVRDFAVTGLVAGNDHILESKISNAAGGRKLFILNAGAQLIFD